MSNQQPIGVFDSGVGGLTVVHAIRRRLPHENIIYLGDTARVPYGNRGADTIRRYSVNASKLLISRDIKALVIACNTASAHGLDAVRKVGALPVLGVIEPVSEAAIQALHSLNHPKKIAILATRATVASGIYPKALHLHDPNAHVFQLACPLLVPFAEEGLHHDPLAFALVERYIDELLALVTRESGNPNLDALILGCTHYPLLQDAIHDIASKRLPPNKDLPLQILNSAESTAEKLAQLLEKQDLLASPGNGNLELLATDSSESFSELATRIFGNPVNEVHHVDISDVTM